MNQNRNDEVNVMDILLYLASKWKWFCCLSSCSSAWPG